MIQPSDLLLEIMGVKIQDFWTRLLGLSKSTRKWYFVLGILCIFYAILKTLNLANLLFLKYLSVVHNNQRKKGVMSPETMNISSPWFITICSAIVWNYNGAEWRDLQSLSKVTDTAALP